MRVYYELDLDTFEAWGGAEDTLNRVREADLIDTLESELEMMYPEGMDETHLNDLLWWEPDWIYELVGLSTEE